MARPLRVEFPGAIYHVTSRGNARQTIFADEDDRQRFLGILGVVVKNHRWLCHAYCLMGNHYHLLLETPEANLARGMRQLNGIYTQACNRRHDRTGHLLQGRYKAILVEKDSYLLALCRYIVLNPVAAGIVPSPEAWPWSSYGATAGLAPVPALLSTDWVLAQFGENRRQARQSYGKFVQQGVGQASPWDDLRGGLLLGGAEFVERFEPMLSERRNLREIPRIQRLAHRPPLERLLAEAHDVPSRTKAARGAHIDWGYTLKEIAETLGVHYSTVSRMIGGSGAGMRQRKT